METTLFEAADQLLANSPLKPSEYSSPVLGLIFLRYADARFTLAQQEIAAKGSGRRQPGKTDYQARGVLYVPDDARFSTLLKLPEGSDIAGAIENAMKLIEQENEDLAGVLPRGYKRFENSVLWELMRIMNRIQLNGGDTFGRIYEYFLGGFARKEGQKGGEFFTPESIVKLIVEVIEPYHGRIYDPACGSGGMFVWSAKFVHNHKKNPTQEISVFGSERVRETMNLCRMNLAVHGLSGDIKQANSYYEDVHNSLARFDFVMANPPFNVSGVDKTRLKDDLRFGLLGETDAATGKKNPLLPNTDNANYLWIQAFYAALDDKGRAGFVMANSAADARGSELEIRKKLIQSGAVDVMVSVGPNMFFTVIRANNGKQAFLYRQLRDKFAEEDSMGNGAIFKAVTKEDMRGIKLVWPTEPILSRYDQIASQVTQQIKTLTLKNRVLRKTRDLLLPKLISGEIDISRMIEDAEETSVAVAAETAISNATHRGSYSCNAEEDGVRSVQGGGAAVGAGAGAGKRAVSTRAEASNEVPLSRPS
jgi:type I restriction-modification system DNA methylase subunit